MLLVLAALGIAGTAIVTGRIDLHALSGKVASATSGPAADAIDTPAGQRRGSIASAVAPIASALEDCLGNDPRARGGRRPRALELGFNPP